MSLTSAMVLQTKAYKARFEKWQRFGQESGPGQRYQFVCWNVDYN